MTAGCKEFELKFTGAAADIAALVTSDFLSVTAPDGGAWQRLSSSYFDTPEGALARKGLSLRLREEGAALIQAVKTRGDRAAARMEYEKSLAHSAEFPAPTGEGTIDAAIAALEPFLDPIAAIRVDRWAATVRFRDADIEIAIDLGMAECTDDSGETRAAGLAEVELELVRGDPAHIFALARLLNNNARLRYAARSKLDFALSLKAPSKVIPPAPRTMLSPEMTAAEALQDCLGDIGARIAELQPFILDLRLPEGVHQMRIALRKLRSVERIFRPYLKQNNKISSLAKRAGRFARALGPARDWDVFLGETLPVVGATDQPLPGLRILKARAEAARAAAWADAVQTISGERFSRFVIDLVEAAALGGWREQAKPALSAPLSDFAPTALDRALSRTFKAASRLPMEAGLVARHPLRIALKKLRYPVQLFRVVYPKSARKEYMGAMSALQDAFGAINDAVAAQSLADHAARGEGEEAVRAAGFVAGFMAAEASAAVETIDASWTAFEKMTPFWQDQGS